MILIVRKEYICKGKKSSVIIENLTVEIKEGATILIGFAGIGLIGPLITNTLVDQISEKIVQEYNLKVAPFALNSSITHHAFFGTPNIVVKIYQIMKEDTNWIAELQIALAHAILHGAPQFYIININPTFLDLETKHNYQRIALSTAYYILSTAVKSFEVTRLLGMKQYINDQIDLLEKNMRITSDEKELWKSSHNNIDAKLLLFSNMIKGLAPFGALRIFIHEPPSSIIKLYNENLSLMSDPYKTLLDNILHDSFPRLGYDTLENISFVTSIIAENLH